MASSTQREVIPGGKDEENLQRKTIIFKWALDIMNISMDECSQ